MTSEINKLIIQGESFDKNIVPIFNIFIFVFKNLYTDLEDLHYKQVLLNLRTTLEIVGEKLGENKEQFEVYLTKFEEKDLDSIYKWDEELPEYSKDVKSLLKGVKKCDYTNKWNHMYTDNNIIFLFQESIGKLVYLKKMCLLV